MNDFIFIVTSCLNTSVGRFTPEERWEQNKATLESIKLYAPNSKILLIDSSPEQLTNDQKSYLDNQCDYTEYLSQQTLDKFVDFDETRFKCSIELYCLFQVFSKHAELLSKFNRVFKISSRYTLTENFDKQLHLDNDKDIIILKAKAEKYTNDPHPLFSEPYQYMTRLVSIPNCEVSNMSLYLKNMIRCYIECKDKSLYYNSEHAFYYHLPKDKIKIVEKIGISGITGGGKRKINE